MTGVLIVRDPDRGRMRRTIESARARLRDDGEPGGGVLEREDVAVVWGTHAGAPVDTHGEGALHAFVIGSVVDGDRHLTAADCAARGWDSSGAPPAADGYHLVVLIDALGALSVDVDPLGLLPMHHWSDGELLLATTSPGLFRSHERFAPRLDPLGLAGVLLTDATVAGRSSLRGVRRLASGHALVAERSAGAREVRTSDLAASDALHDADIATCATVVHDALDDALRRHARPGAREVLMLSGGRDSRLLAGILASQGRRVETVTFGQRTDLEARFAGRVARELDLSHRLLPDAEDESAFEAIVLVDGLSTTPSVDRPDVGPGVDSVHSGLLLDTTWADPVLDVAFGAGEATAADRLLADASRHALGTATLQRLLRPEVFAGCLETVADDFRLGFERSGSSVLERTWRWGIETRGRHWLAAALWRLTRTAWPSIAHLDRAVISAGTSVPLALLAGRRLEDEIIVRHHPVLASIPLDLTTFETTAISPRLADMVRSSAERRLRFLANKVRLPVPETRCGTRTLSIEREGWIDVRRRMEAHRSLAHELFEPTVLAEVLPPAGAPWPGRPTYPHSSGGKLLLAVLALLGDGVTV